MYTVTVTVLDDDMALRSEDVQGHGQQRGSHVDREPLKHDIMKERAVAELSWRRSPIPGSTTR